MSESGAFVAGGGGFVRVRDSSQGFSAEFKRQQQLEAERQRLKQAELDRLNRQQEEERRKQAVQNQAIIKECSRAYYARDTASWMRVGIIDRYSRARGISFDQGAAELDSLEMVQQVDPDRYAKYQKRMKTQESMVDLKVEYPRCKFCKNWFLDANELAAHLRETKPCPHRCGVCSAGGDVHRCSVYGGSIIEDRLQVPKDVEVTEEAEAEFAMAAWRQQRKEKE
jgi:hypothetical protein